jgi:crossover junction endodeoxyribonuclease RuvC
MIILGIDPGIADTGYGIIKKCKDNFEVVEYGTIKTKKTELLPQRLEIIYKSLSKLIKKHKPEIVGIEQIFFSKNTKTAINVAHARGIILLTAIQYGCKIMEFTPLQIKQALTGYGGADKLQMQKMVQCVLKLSQIPKPDDASDALACAICAGQTKTY